MELILLDKNFGLLGMPIDDFTSLQWKRRWKEGGGFELHLSKEYFATASAARYLYQNEDKETMAIVSAEYEEKRGEVTLGGKPLNILFDDIVIPKTEVIRGNLETEARRIVKKYAIDGTQKIDKLCLGAARGYSETVDTQMTGISLYEALYTLLAEENLTWRLSYDYTQDALIFEIVKGKDRTQDQNENAWAVFSTSRENILNMEYQRSEEDYKNYAFVAGEGEGQARTVVEVDRSNGEKKKAIYIDARDLQKEQDESTAQYRQRLIARGVEKLTKYKKTESITGEAAADALPRLGLDYDMGDKCDFENPELGISFQSIVTGIDKVYEAGAHSVTPIFGEVQLNLRQIISREVSKDK